jgi:hypothetical protein
MRAENVAWNISMQDSNPAEKRRVGFAHMVHTKNLCFTLEWCILTHAQLRRERFAQSLVVTEALRPGKYIKVTPTTGI